MTPAKVVEALEPPAERILPPKLTLVPATPARAPIVEEEVTALTSKTAPDVEVLTVPLVALRAPDPSKARVPALMVVPPVYVLAALNVRVPDPVFARLPELLITPDRVLRPAETATLLALIPLRRANVVVSLISRVPVPRPVLLANAMVPAERVVPPEQVFTPLKTSVLAPVFARLPELLI